MQQTYTDICVYIRDDVWNKIKVETAVRVLDTMPKKIANIYFHNFTLTNELLDPISTYHNHIEEYSFQKVITECLHMGFVTMMNRVLRDLVLQEDISKIPTHDWWMEFGNVYTDDTLLAMHRYLDDSISGMSLKNRIQWFFRKMCNRSDVLTLGHEFVKVYSEQMKVEDKRVIDLFYCEHYNFAKVLKKCFISNVGEAI